MNQTGEGATGWPPTRGQVGQLPNGGQPVPPVRYRPLRELVLARLREFYREPEAIFWVYGFPILMVVALGIAFRNQPVEKITVDVQNGPFATNVANVLLNDPERRFNVRLGDEETTSSRLRTGKTELVVIPRTNQPTGEKPPEKAKPASKGPPVRESTLAVEYFYDPTRPESLLAWERVNDALQKAEGRKDPIPSSQKKLEDIGSRYIDFLIPGLLGMSLMGGGLWGVGFVIVEMRLRRLLKRFLATPMKRTHFLASIMLSRLIFMVPEVLILLLFGKLAFGVSVQGSLVAVVALVLLGAFTFAGLGLLVGSRAKTLEAVSGLMHLVMMPMWVLSGIFFSSERFPEAAQPFIKALPLTPLIDALRAVMLEGTALAALWPQLAILAGWGVASFGLALWWFRWH